MDPGQQAIREIAAGIITGRLRPREGAKLIAAEAAGLDEPGELGVFADLARDGEDDAILERASLLVADTA